jgi:hydrogenase nickel incorporation protein HypA/HybF
MHELYLAESIIGILKDYGARHRFNKVNTVRLSFGKLSCIEAKSLQFAFEVQSRGTRAQGAVLEFDILPAVIHCLSCERDIEIEDAYSGVCPNCRGEEVVLTSGTEELKVLELDVD